MLPAQHQGLTLPYPPLRLPLPGWCGTAAICPAPGSHLALPPPPSRSYLPGWCGTAATCPAPGSRPALPSPSSTSPRSRCPAATPRPLCWHHSWGRRYCSTTKRCGGDGRGKQGLQIDRVQVPPPCTGAPLCVLLCTFLYHRAPPVLKLLHFCTSGLPLPALSSSQPPHPALWTPIPHIINCNKAFPLHLPGYRDSPRV